MTETIEISTTPLVVPVDETISDDSMGLAGGIVYGVIFSIPLWLVILSVIHWLSS